MKQKHIDEIKGALISTGAVMVILKIVPQIDEIYSNLYGLPFIGLGLIAIGAFWL